MVGILITGVPTYFFIYTQLARIEERQIAMGEKMASSIDEINKQLDKHDDDIRYLNRIIDNRQTSENQSSDNSNEQSSTGNTFADIPKKIKLPNIFPLSLN